MAAGQDHQLLLRYFTEIDEKSLPESPNAAHKARLIKLLDYTSYSEKETARPNPFDDPYVGAALVDNKFKILGSHRKYEGQERHAEPSAILAALANLSDPFAQSATQIVGQINNAYHEKIWLKGVAQLREFESLFEAAGDLLRKGFQCDELSLYSTLEPCRDYESQPSCACLICASAIANVFYASDDTNLKGQGRDILKSGRDPRGRKVANRSIPVEGNLAVEEALKINRLFFTSVDGANRLYGEWEIGHRWVGPAYLTFRLDKDYLSKEFDSENRLLLQRSDEHELPIYYLASSQIGISADVEPSDQIDLNAYYEHSSNQDLVLMVKDITVSGVVAILCDRARHRLAVPTTIISTTPLPTSERVLQELVAEGRVRVYQNAFCKRHEVFSAQKFMLLTRIREHLSNHLYILVKLDNSGSPLPGEASAEVKLYEHIFENPAECLARLKDICRPAKLTIFTTTKNCEDAKKLLVDLKAANLFKTGKSLAECSIEVLVCYISERDDRRFTVSYLKREVDQLELSHRVFSVREDKSPAVLPAAQVSRLIEHFAIDPCTFSPEYLSELTDSQEWRDRRNAGSMLSTICMHQRSLIHKLIIEEINSAITFGIVKKWARLCTVLNALHDISRPTFEQGDIDAIRTVLGTLGGALEEHLKTQSQSKTLIDVVWRWSACWARHASKDKLADPLRESKLGRYIASDSFLLTQLIYYTAVSENDIGEGRASIALSALAGLSTDQTNKDVALICARLAFARRFVNVGDAKCSIKVMRVAVESFCVSEISLFDDEVKRCETAWSWQITSISQVSQQEMGKVFATLVNLRTLQATLARSMRRYVSNATSPITIREVERSWRGDQETVVERTLSELPPVYIPGAIQGLVSDADVSTRWGGITHVLKGGSLLQRALVLNVNKKAEWHRLREFRRNCVRSALGTNGHYWLIREVLSNYADETAVANGRSALSHACTEATWGLPAISTLGIDNVVLCENADQLHPEVASQLKRYLSVAKTIALVLPPIEVDDSPDGDSNQSVNSGSPPLGLGQIASHLSSMGHFVQIFDAHRFKFRRDHLVACLQRFDFVGFSVVISTMESTKKITSDLVNGRQAKIANDRKDGRAGNSSKIILGGHAPTLLRPSHIGEQIDCFDYLVIGPGEQAFEEILRHHSIRNGQESLLCHPETGILDRGTVLAPNSSQGRVPQQTTQPAPGEMRSQLSNRYQGVLDQLGWTDRAIFVEPRSRVVYEPVHTRDGNHVEAHIVISRGCEWKCSFCTEALIAGKSGENRRSVNDIIGEIRHLTTHYKVNRIQFIDDNVFPTQPWHMRLREQGGQEYSQRGLEWLSDFINQLRAFRTGCGIDKPFSWRGLMRIEDFLFYESKIPDFPRLLAQSGCNLLAFGVESGNPEKRMDLKRGLTELRAQEQHLRRELIDDSGNDTIVAMIGRLRANGIYSKGYFILGGKTQTRNDIEETVDFAVASDFDLAYFAIYKDFRGIVDRSSGVSNGHKIEFSLFTADIQGALDDPGNENRWSNTFGTLHTPEERQSYSTAFKELSRLGFSFNDIIKYNDYHKFGDVYTRMGFDETDAYLRRLAAAYLQFYGRKAWFERYRALIASGY